LRDERKEIRMKKFILVTSVIFLCVSTVLAADFAPSVMKISVPDIIQYDFDGSELSIPATIEGAPANATLLVYTSGKGGSIGKVQNGHLGWHYVNRSRR